MNLPPRSNSPITLATLICERDAAMAAITLPRLQANCRDAASLTIFEDGSLTERSANHLLEKLKGARLIRRKELDETIGGTLTQRPNSRAYWKDYPLALKLLGIPVALKFDFIYFDCDILLVKPVSLRPLHVKAETAFVFMQDVADGYSGRSTDLKLRHGLRLLSRLNSGVMAIPAAGYDPDFIEWFLGVPQFRNFPFLLEQTCWSVMPRGRSVEYVDPRLIWCADGQRQADADTVGIHYIQHTKSQISADAAQFADRADLSPVVLTSVSAPELGLWRMARNFTRRLVQR